MLKGKLGKAIIIVFAAVIIGIAAFSYMFRGVNNSVENKKALFSLSADDLYSSFETNENAANEKYLGKVLEVTGVISSIENTPNGQLIIMLSCNSPMGGVRCNFESKQEKIAEKVTSGTNHTIKGKCSGMLMEVVLDNCSLVY